MDNEYLLLFEDCKIVSGFTNTLLYDLNRSNNSNYIPDSLKDFIYKCKTRPLQDVLEDLNENDKKIAQEYVDFIIDREFGHLCDTAMKKGLIPLSLNLNAPEFIGNAIIELRNTPLKQINKIVSLMEITLCSAIEIRLYNSSTAYLETVIDKFKGTIVESIYIHIDPKDKLDKSHLEELFKKHFRVKIITAYNVNAKNENGIYYILGSLEDQIINSYNVKKHIISQPIFIEAVNYHTYYNKKIFISSNGEIKNAPESEEVFGNINLINNLEEVKRIIQTTSFQKYWFVTKDKTKVCKDCEYRYMCLDNRLPVQTKENEWEHTSKCDYNPYEGKWNGENE